MLQYRGVSETLFKWKKPDTNGHMYVCRIDKSIENESRLAVMGKRGVGSACLVGMMGCFPGVM